MVWMKVVVFCGSPIMPHSRSCSITLWGRTVERVLGTGAVWSMCQSSLVGTLLEQAAVSSAKTEDGGVLAPCWSRQPCPVLRRKMWIGLLSLPETGWNVRFMMFCCPPEGDGML